MEDGGYAVDLWGGNGCQGVLLEGGALCLSAEARRTGRSWLEADR